MSGGDLAPGTRIASYVIGPVLGRGGMGVVYEAEHTVLGKIVAVKVVAPALAEDRPFVERFLREARMAASIDHPAILPVHDAGESGGTVFFAMPRVYGVDLGRLLEREGPLTRERTLALLVPIAQGLDMAHDRHLVHRDVKPGNIVVELPEYGGRSERAFLMDFGLGKQLDRRTQLSVTGTFTGTFRYAAPEQFMGRPVDGRTDQYALACVLFECLTGSGPFEAETEGQLMYAHLQAEPPSPSARRPDIPPEADTVLARALAKEKEQRYPRCVEFVEAFRAASSPRAQTVVARPPAPPPGPPPPPPLAPLRPPMVVQGHLGAEGPREERLRRIIAPSVLLVLSSILVVVGGLISLSDRSTGSSAAGDVSGMIVFGGPQLLLAVALAIARRRRPRQVWSILALVLGAVSLVLAATASRTASGSGNDTLILLVILASILWIVAGLTALVSTRSRSGDSPAR